MGNGIPRRTDDARLADRMAAAADVDRPSILVDHLKPGTSDPSPDWVDDFVTLVQQYGFSAPQIRRVSADLAWLARTAGQRYPNDEDRARVLAADNGRTARLCLVYIEGQRFRFDFRFAKLHERCVEWLAEFEDDALVRGLAAFAALGRRASNGRSLFQRAVEAPDADDKSNQVCLMGIWLADHLPEQPQMLLRLSEDMMARGQANAVVHYRRAAAFRKLGEFDEALREIDQAIDGLAAGDNLVHEQFAQERRAIVLASDLRDQMERNAEALTARITSQVDEKLAMAGEAMRDRIDEAAEKLTQRVDAAQEMVSSGLLKMIEILGLFVTLVGFIAGSGAVVVKARSFGDRAVAMTLVLVGALAFFGLLRLVTTVRRPRRS